MDYDDTPLWWNGGVLANKHHVNEGTPYLTFTHWAMDRTSQHVKWDWESKDKPFCLEGKNGFNGNEIGELTLEEKQITEKYLEIYKELDVLRLMEEPYN